MPRRIRVIETGEIYDSMAECAKAIGGDVSGVSKTLRGLQRSYLGFTFARAGLVSKPKQD